MTRTKGVCGITHVVVALTFVGACGGPLHNARAMTSSEQHSIVARPPPDRVPAIDGLSSVGARVRIDSTPRAVWRIMAVGFGDIDDWAGSGVAASACTSGGEGELGAIRSCTIAKHVPMFGGDTYEEKIVRWDESRGYFAVIQTRATGPTEILISENWISSDGAGATVVTQIVYMDLTFPASWMKGRTRTKFKRSLVEGLIGLKHFCEAGEQVTPSNYKAVVEMYPLPLRENGV